MFVTKILPNKHSSEILVLWNCKKILTVNFCTPLYYQESFLFGKMSFEHWRSSQATSRFLRLSLMGLVMVHLMLMIISRMVGVKIDSAISRISLLLLRLDRALLFVVTWIETPFVRIQNYPMVIVFPVFSIKYLNLTLSVHGWTRAVYCLNWE